jgi:hypothetical protein
MRPDAVLEALDEALGGRNKDDPGLALAVNHVADVCSILTSNRNFEPDSWKEVVTGALGMFISEKKAADISMQLREHCFKETRPRQSQVCVDV